MHFNTVAPLIAGYDLREIHWASPSPGANIAQMVQRLRVTPMRASTKKRCLRCDRLFTSSGKWICKVCTHKTIPWIEQ